MENNYYSSNTLYLTSRGMLSIKDICDEDEIYYIDDKGKIQKTNKFNIINKYSCKVELLEGSHLYIETSDNYSVKKNSEIKRVGVDYKLYNIKLAHNIQDKRKFNNEIYQIVDINGRDYEITNLDRMVLTFYFENYFKFNKKENYFEHINSFDGRIYYIVDSMLFDTYGILMKISNKNYSEILKNKILDDLNLDLEYYDIKNKNDVNTLSPHSFIRYFLNGRLDMFEDFVNRLEYFKVSYLWSNETHHQLYFYSFRLAVNFQTLLSLIGYKTYLRYDKELNRFYVVYFNSTGATNTKIKKIKDLESKHDLYNIYFPELDEPVYLITANTNKTKETCISYNLSAFKYTDKN